MHGTLLNIIFVCFKNISQQRMLNRVKQKYLKLPFHSFILFVDILIKKYISPKTGSH